MNAVLKLAKSIASLFEGAETSKHRTSGETTPRDSKYDLTRWSREKLMAQARKLYANDGLTRGSIRDLAQYSVGNGLMPQANSGDENFDNAAEAYWREWCKVADVTGKNNFNRIQRLLSIAIDRDGDVGLLMSRTETGWPQIQLVEAHRIGSETDSVPNADGWFDGVKVNRVGRPVAYKIAEGDLGNGTRTYREVPASDFIHLFDAERCDQTRGVTALYHAINTLRDKKDIIDFEKITVKRNSSIWAKMKTPSGETTDWDDEEEDEVNGQKVAFKKVQGGEMTVVASDEDMTPWESNRPSPAFTGFLEFLIRDVATGLGLPYEFVWNPEKLGGTGNRFVLAKAQRRFSERQDLLIQNVLNRLWFWVVSVGIKRGDLTLPRPDLKVWNVTWQRPAELTVDAGRDATADRDDVKMGLMTEAEHYGRRGLDWKEARAQKEAEVDDLLIRANALAKKHKIDVQVALTLLQQGTPNGLTFTVQSPGQKNDGETKAAA